MYVTCKSVGSGARLRGFFLLPEASGGVSLVQGRFALSEPLPALEHGGYVSVTVPQNSREDSLRERMRRVELGPGCRQYFVNVNYRHFIRISQCHGHKLGLCGQVCSLLAVWLRAVI